MTGLPSPEIITQPFGAGDSYRPTFPSAQTFGQISFETGIGSEYSVPTASGGVKLTRHDMNELGYLATQAAYLNQCGYAYQWNQTICNAIGGYPKGAILKWIEWDSSKSYPVEVLEIISLKDNNFVKPVDVDLGTAIDITTGSETVMSGSWAVVDRRNTYNFFPDYSTRTLVWNGSYTSATTTSTGTLGGDGPYWYYIERTIGNWDSLTDQQKISATPSITVRTPMSTFGSNQIIRVIHGCEGKLFSSMIPVTNFSLDIAYTSAAVVSGELDINVYRFGMITETN